MQIFIRQVDGKVTTIDVEPAATIEEAKELIYDKTGIEPKHQRLIFAGTNIN